MDERTIWMNDDRTVKLNDRTRKVSRVSRYLCDEITEKSSSEKTIDSRVIKKHLSREINDVLGRTSYCERSGRCVSKKESFKCRMCGRMLSLDFREKGQCIDCSIITRQKPNIQKDFRTKKDGKLEYDTIPANKARSASIGMGSFRPELTVFSGIDEKRVYPLNKKLVRKNIRIGRDLTNDIMIPDEEASRNHAVLFYDSDALIIKDASSTNGIFINNIKMTESVLHDMDVIMIGDHRLLFSKGTNTLTYLNGPNSGKIVAIDRIMIQKDFNIGRCITNQIILDSADDMISRHHARIIFQYDKFLIEDVGSLNGTYLNDELVLGMAELKNNDRIEIGKTKLMFKLT